MSKTSSYDIEIVPVAHFVPEQSDEAEHHYVFAYRIAITNRSEVPVQLIARHWLITDMEGRVQEVSGMGVIGEQPVLQPGQSFEYMSGATLDTPVGTMRGSYQMRTHDGTVFDARIPEFVLSIPRTLH
ncbi:Co2+/Mg2+ efflux protein ApaG [Amantichitinum ursilacus]|uniref:Protein ApaG n=1 Tax=Amantichitinum ursilacus TaxID=857265 RepID=A0A0N1JTN2_9NEIS|nr:Co2+/Mg2+ efflux protein ApaG [Amantichitinum ursilacus]KPC55072.1 CO2+/MG2+ efflux protein ApaG [Amantichitinum ursilacus]